MGILFGILSLADTGSAQRIIAMSSNNKKAGDILESVFRLFMDDGNVQKSAEPIMEDDTKAMSVTAM